MKNAIRKIYLPYLKRVLDILFSILGLLLLWPVMLGIGIAIKKDSRGSIIFKQKRLGKNLKIFTIYKFRTMVPGAYEAGGAKSFDGDPRITKIGAYLRKTSLDELPQLVNILKGEMSIIGPRPILKEEFEEYKEDTLYIKRFMVNPGLFCSVDLKYRAAASREIQFKMDAEYAECVSFLKDVTIFFYIIAKVLKQENIYPVQSESPDKKKDQ